MAKQSKTRFLENGFYVANESFREKDLLFVTGEIVGVIWLRGLCYATKTGKELGGNANLMESENALKLRRLSMEEIFELTDNHLSHIRVFKSVSSFVTACKLFSGKRLV